VPIEKIAVGPLSVPVPFDAIPQASDGVADFALRAKSGVALPALVASAWPGADYAGGDQISRYQLLTDIIGWEDAFCDMDCKLAGTPDGLTGFQLDLKLRGIPHKIMSEAVEKAGLHSSP